MGFKSDESRVSGHGGETALQEMNLGMVHVSEAALRPSEYTNSEHKLLTARAWSFERGTERRREASAAQFSCLSAGYDS